MAKISVEVDVSSEFKRELEIALAKVMQELVDRVELAIAEEIVSESEFTEKDADELAEKVKVEMHAELKNSGL